jgi:flagellar motor switch/type III secretory pathway protein FliN
MSISGPETADGSLSAGGGAQALPLYTRSLLRISLPVTVTLAVKKQPIGRIIELGPGSIIQFDKSCEELLALEVGGQEIAQGEPVKVGDKFGIRLKALKLPDEHFITLKKRS